MLISAGFYTANVLLIRALGEFESVNIWLMSCARFVIGIALVAALYPKEWRPQRIFLSRKLASRGIVGGMTVYGFYLTVVHLGAGRATFINNTYVIFGALGAVWVLRERLHASLAIGSIVALTGLALLTNPFVTNQGPGIYDLVGVVTALGSAYVVVIIRQLHATEHTATIFAAQSIYGLLLCAVPAAFHPLPVSVVAWVLMLLGGICAAVGQITMTHAFRILPVAEGALLQMTVPLGIAAGGLAFFGERFTGNEIAGALLILAGTVVTAVRR